MHDVIEFQPDHLTAHYIRLCLQDRTASFAAADKAREADIERRRRNAGDCCLLMPQAE